MCPGRQASARRRAPRQGAARDGAPPARGGHLSRLLALTAELVDIPSVSFHEQAITDHLERMLAPVPWLELTRMGNNLVARTRLGRPQRLVLAGHTDTVPPNANERARVDADVCWGLGACDMKGGVAVLAELARTVTEPATDVTYVFYECEEVAERYNGLDKLFRERPDLVAGDVAVLAEPSAARIQAGCQGTLRARATFVGTRAHSARAWLGRNAIHRLGPALATLSAYEGRQVEIDGCRFREGLQAVRVEGGVAGNVVPDRATLTVNFRFAPDRSPAEAEAHVRDVLFDADEVELLDVAAAAPPSLGHPLLTTLAAHTGVLPEAKLGWTDVARFASHGVPATNYGPGDPNLAHHADEHVTAADLDTVYGVLRRLLQEGAPTPSN